MWSCTECWAIMMLRMYWAFSGTSTFRACSTERMEEMACTVVQTPQKRWAKDHASWGSRPLRMTSIPRHIWAEDQALVTLPSFTSTSMRRCPSIRVMGSRVILVDICYSSDLYSSIIGATLCGCQRRRVGRNPGGHTGPPLPYVCRLPTLLAAAVQADPGQD